MGIPAELWTTFCPFRTLRMPDVLSWIRLYGRWSRYRVLPDQGGIDDQEERTMRVFDVISNSLDLTRVHEDS